MTPIEQTYMIGVQVDPDTLRSGEVPSFIECNALPTRQHPAERRTVVRADGESGDALWQRVVNTIRALKLGRSFNQAVLLSFHYGSAPSPEHFARGDGPRNFRGALWHTAVTDPNALLRVQALCILSRSVGADRRH